MIVFQPDMLSNEFQSSERGTVVSRSHCCLLNQPQTGVATAGAGQVRHSRCWNGRDSGYSPGLRPKPTSTNSETPDWRSTVSRCRVATVPKIFLTPKFFCRLCSVCNRPDRNLADIRVFGDSNGGQRAMIDFEGWDMGYADARNGQPSQCPPNVDPISYLGGYREGCSAHPAHTSVLARIRRGLNR